MVYQYLSERGLVSARAPMQWKILTQEGQAAADVLLRNAINIAKAADRQRPRL
jgi:hypothetical protein